MPTKITPFSNFRKCLIKKDPSPKLWICGFDHFGTPFSEIVILVYGFAIVY